MRDKENIVITDIQGYKTGCTGTNTPILKYNYNMGCEVSGTGMEKRFPTFCVSFSLYINYYNSNMQ